MEKIQYLLMGISILLIGLFITLFSKRLARVMIESTKLLGNEFGIKRSFGRGFDLFVQGILIIFGIAVVLVALRVFMEMF